MKASELARQILAQIAVHGDLEIGRYNPEFASHEVIMGVGAIDATKNMPGGFGDDDERLGARFLAIE